MCAVPGLEEKQALKTSNVGPRLCSAHDGEKSGKKQRAHSKVPDVITSDGSAAERADLNRHLITEPPAGGQSITPEPKQGPKQHGGELQFRTLAQPKLCEPGD